MSQLNNDQMYTISGLLHHLNKYVAPKQGDLYLHGWFRPYEEDEDTKWVGGITFDQKKGEYVYDLGDEDGR